jgi:mRNA interferase MazF
VELPELSALPGNVAVSADLAGLEADSVVNVTQVATIDRAALEEHIGALPDWVMAQVDTGLGRALALAHP